MSKQTSLATLGKSSTKGFQDAVKQEYIKKYAQDVVVMIEDKKNLEKALNRVTSALQEVENGNYDAIEKYKSSRKRLEYEDNANF